MAVTLVHRSLASCIGRLRGDLEREIPALKARYRVIPSRTDPIAANLRSPSGGTRDVSKSTCRCRSCPGRGSPDLRAKAATHAWPLSRSGDARVQGLDHR